MLKCYYCGKEYAEHDITIRIAGMGIDKNKTNVCTYQFYCSDCEVWVYIDENVE